MWWSKFIHKSTAHSQNTLLPNRWAYWSKIPCERAWISAKPMIHGDYLLLKYLALCKSQPKVWYLLQGHNHTSVLSMVISSNSTRHADCILCVMIRQMFENGKQRSIQHKGVYNISQRRLDTKLWKTVKFIIMRTESLILNGHTM